MDFHHTIYFVMSVASFAWQAEAGLPLTQHHGETMVLPPEHQMVERQQPACDSNEVQRRIAALDCDAEFIAALMEEGFYRCVSTINDEIQECGFDQDGTLCALHSGAGDSARDIEEQCFRPLSETFGNCSSQCQSSLVEYSNSFGCCIHVFATGDDAAKVLTPLLWSQCGVTRPEPCDNAPVLNAPDQSTSSDQSCPYSNFCLLARYEILECQYLASRKLEIYEECNDTESAHEIRQDCGFNERGEYCIFLTVMDTVDAFSVYQKCYGFFKFNECRTGCRAALEDLKERLGCCVNSVNGTTNDDAVQALITRYDLWSTCGVETPGFCNLPTDTSLYDDPTFLCNTCDDM